MPSSLTPGSSTSHVSSVAMATRPSPRSERLGTPNTPAIRFTRDPVFEASLVRVCYGLSGCSPPWTDRTKFPWPTGDFYIQASGGSVAFPAAGYDYNSTGLLCWRDFHPQEWQLASLHPIPPGCPPGRRTAAHELPHGTLLSSRRVVTRTRPWRPKPPNGAAGCSRPRDGSDASRPRVERSPAGGTAGPGQAGAAADRQAGATFGAAAGP